MLLGWAGGGRLGGAPKEQRSGKQALQGPQVCPEAPLIPLKIAFLLCQGYEVSHKIYLCLCPRA